MPEHMDIIMFCYVVHLNNESSLKSLNHSKCNGVVKEAKQNLRPALSVSCAVL